MEIKGQLNDEEVFKAIENSFLLRTMKAITEDASYEPNEKYVILEGILQTWGNEQ